MNELRKYLKYIEKRNVQPKIKYARRKPVFHTIAYVRILFHFAQNKTYNIAEQIHRVSVIVCYLPLRSA